MVLSFVKCVVDYDGVCRLTMTGYLLETNGGASLARKGWFVIMRAADLVEENNRLEHLSDYSRISNFAPLEGSGSELSTDVRL